MTLSSADIGPPIGIRIASSEAEATAVAAVSAEELLRQALEVLAQRPRPLGEFDSVVEDYERRVAEARPYESTVNREELRRRYGV